MTARVATQAAKAAIRGSQSKYEVYVRGLDWRTGKTELRQHFENYGKIQTVYVMMNKYTGLSTGRAIVKFREYGALTAALENKNQVVDGENVEVLSRTLLSSAKNTSVQDEVVTDDIDASTVEDINASTVGDTPSEVDTPSEKD